MPDKRRHRGPHPQDSRLFNAQALPDLRIALADYVDLLSKGYAPKSSLKLVGDHFNLDQRQRLALMRSACSRPQRERRRAHQVSLDDCAGRSLAIDGYNVLITLEAALSGAPVFVGCDGCVRDLAGLHGTYRKVEETLPALQLLGDFFTDHHISEVTWFLDSPVSNSGRLKTLMRETAQAHHWPWDIQLSLNPDAVLKTSQEIVVTTDSVILDHCPQWCNLAMEVVHAMVSSAWIVELLQ